jgi:light-regulated signal transduction histidine kinase (bacteriophytochrome)
MKDLNNGQLSVIEADNAREAANELVVLRKYSAALANKLETRGAELTRVVAELQHAHEQILELNRTVESRVAQRTAALEAANQELEAFSSSIAHDLRTPLLNITGFAGLLEELSADRLDAGGRDSLARIIASAARMNELIEALLVFAHLGREQLKPTQIDLQDVLEEALQALRPDCQGRNIQWQRKRLPRALADPILLRQVFVNLIGNAIKYTRTRDPAVIEIGWRAGRADELVIFVRDNGVGFDMQHVTTLFGVFKRIAGVEAFEGIGIGLANAHRIVTRHGGRIWAEAQIGRGATFSFTLLRAAHVEHNRV